jgi:G3E family GTPase
MKTTRLILVGGFLGSGKTTLLWESARRIMGNNQHTGLITNDQAPELVDTAILLQHNVKVAEVSGSCFCCNFDGFQNAIQQVRGEANADVIVAEPVGSCTDLSATIIQPLKEKMKHELIISPLSVLSDPKQLTDILNGGTAGLHPDAAYIFLKQLEESDIILINKTDLLSKDELSKLTDKARLSFPDSEIMGISAKTGEGIDEWLNEVLTRSDAGKRIAEVDYDKYAEGEAALGWLNTTIELNSESGNWDEFANKLLKDLSRQFDHLGASVGHVKIIIESGTNYLMGNLTGLGKTLNSRGTAGTGKNAKLTLNARVELTPDDLEKIVRDTLDVNTRGICKAKIVAFRCLSPGRPNPTYRFDHIVTD